MKRQAPDTDTSALDPVARRTDELLRAKLAEVSHAFAFTDATLSEILPGVRERKHILGRIATTRDRSVHSLHPEVRKTDLELEFHFVPSKLAVGERPRVQLDTDFLPEALEVVSGFAADADASQLCVHNIRVLGGENRDAPFQVCLLSNAFHHGISYLQLIGDPDLYYQWMQSADRAEGLPMPEDGGESVMAKLNPQRPYYVESTPKDGGNPVSELHVPPAVEFAPMQVGRIVPAGHLTPEGARAAMHNTPEALRHGIHPIVLEHPYTGAMTHFGLLAADHALAVYAFTNYEEERLLFEAWQDETQPRDQKARAFVLLEAELIDRLVAKLCERNRGAVPLCPAERISFELRRLNTAHWTALQGCLEGTQPEDFEREMCVRWRIEMHYSMFVPAIPERCIISVPGKAPSAAQMRTAGEDFNATLRGEAGSEARQEDFGGALEDLMETNAS